MLEALLKKKSESAILKEFDEKLIKEEAYELIPLIELILASKEMAKYSPIEELPLEIAIIKWCNL